MVSTIGATQLFGEPLLYHSGQPDGGTQGQYQTLGLLMYQQGWTNDRLGLASATAWTMFVIIVLAVAVNLAAGPLPQPGGPADDAARRRRTRRCTTGSHRSRAGNAARRPAG